MLLTRLHVQLNGLCYDLSSWSSSVLNSSELNNVAIRTSPWTARVRLNVFLHVNLIPCQVERTLARSTTTDRHLFPMVSEILHSSFITTLLYSTSTRLQQHIPTCHFKRSSSRPSFMCIIWTVLECTCDGRE